MGYIIEKIQIQNLKYVTDDNPIFVDTEKCNMVILNGQNGYGKTTFFDAVELLTMGEIGHLTQIANRQSAAKIMEELANTPDRDINIIGWLRHSDGEQIILRRKFKWDNSFESEIFWNNEIINQDRLDANLQINNNLFSMAAYMSQSKSLSFLENKSKDRKALVTNLVSTKDVDDKVVLLRDTSQALKEKIENKQKELDTKVSEFTNQIETLKNEINISKEANKESEDYVRLFEEDYIFDKEEIDVSITYLSFVEPLVQIRSFLTDFEDYLKIIKNNKIDYALNIPKQIYMKLYFSNLVKEIDDNQEIIKNVEKCHLFLSDITRGNWNVDVELCKVIGTSDKDVIEIKNKIDNLNSFIQNLGNTEQILLGIQESRIKLIEKYHAGLEVGQVEENKCPLCGSFHDDIDKVFEGAEKKLLKSIEDSSLMKTQLVYRIKLDFDLKVVPLINTYIAKYSRLYTNSVALKACKGLDTNELEDIMREYRIGLGDFETNQVVEMTAFEEQYANTIHRLIGLKENVSKIISEEVLENYKAIHSKYYRKEKPTHSTKDIDRKISYIAGKYVSGASRRIAELEEKRVDAEKMAKQFETASKKVLKNVSDLYKKYNDANKDYQSKLANAIRLPVLIYSGKILQNFPLGLGIDTKVAKNQLTFESFEKKGTDVFNILSTGQLNGLAIAIMLAIRNVYGKKSGLDVLLIDDPLQTIDEISAISLADLLSNSNINQVIMSTHEDRKARMLEYKFTQRNLNVKEVNMKRVYLKSRTSVD